jgi:hypothetical protein
VFEEMQEWTEGNSWRLLCKSIKASGNDIRSEMNDNKKDKKRYVFKIFLVMTLRPLMWSPLITGITQTQLSDILSYEEFNMCRH